MVYYVYICVVFVVYIKFRDENKFNPVNCMGIYYPKVFFLLIYDFDFEFDLSVCLEQSNFKLFYYIDLILFFKFHFVY